MKLTERQAQWLGRLDHAFDLGKPLGVYADSQGLSLAKLLGWERALVCHGVAYRAAGERTWTAAARFEAVLITSPMDEASESSWCRENGSIPRSWLKWRGSVMQALVEPGSGALHNAQERHQIKERPRGWLKG